MGKSLPPTARVREFARFIVSNKLHRPKLIKPAPRNRVAPSLEPDKQRRVRAESEQLRRVKMEESSEEGLRRRQEVQNNRLPLAAVVADCVKRWFQDTLKEAKAGDGAMQVLVGQMYYNGYGVPRDAQKGRAWIDRASKNRSSVWKVVDKRPGYNASDSDSDDMEGDVK